VGKSFLSKGKVKVGFLFHLMSSLADPDPDSELSTADLDSDPAFDYTVGR
jgi:hypothetical protein